MTDRVARRRHRLGWTRGALLLICGLSPFLSRAATLLPPPPIAQSGVMPEIALIIDDMGSRLDAGRQVVRLPGPVACAFLPFAAHTPTLARLAHDHNKEVLLHLPMQSMDGAALDAGAVTLDMTEQQLTRTLKAALARVPHVVGLNNHQGSLLTRHPGHMLWLMRALRADPQLYFVDSRTTKYTVARQIAYENRVPSVSRDVFLDADPSAAGVEREFKRLLELARRNGSAVGIGHPHFTTLTVLARELPRLSSRHGAKLVPVARLVQRQQERDSLWRASWSP